MSYLFIFPESLYFLWALRSSFLSFKDEKQTDFAVFSTLSFSVSDCIIFYHHNHQLLKTLQSYP